MAEKRVVLHTTMGDITIRLYGDMPVTAGNFEKLVRSGFYDGTLFHRVIDGFMIQGGDPTGTEAAGRAIPSPTSCERPPNVRGRLRWQTPAARTPAAASSSSTW